MSIQKLYVKGYRSLFRVYLPLNSLNVLVGPNGSGKTNLYRSMYLLHQASQGLFARSIAEEGGMASALWAGDRKKGPVRMSLEIRIGDYTYELVSGLPQRENTMFILDPEIKEENLWYHKGNQKVHLLERNRSRARIRDADGKWEEFTLEYCEAESIFAELREPEKFPTLEHLRREFLSWRFYHQFRTDPDSPLRQPQVGVRTTTLGHDGRDLAAVLQTILESGQGSFLHQAVESAFPGSQLVICNGSGGFSVGMMMPGIRRVLTGRELSDGTLQYLCLLAVFLSPRPPTFLALNEPESSVHPDLLQPLAQLIAEASKSSQIWITTHSERLAQMIHKFSGIPPIHVRLKNGATIVNLGEEE